MRFLAISAFLALFQAPTHAVELDSGNAATLCDSGEFQSGGADGCHTSASVGVSTVGTNSPLSGDGTPGSEITIDTSAYVSRDGDTMISSLTVRGGGIETTYGVKGATVAITYDLTAASATFTAGVDMDSGTVSGNFRVGGTGSFNNIHSTENAVIMGSIGIGNAGNGAYMLLVGSKSFSAAVPLDGAPPRILTDNVYDDTGNPAVNKWSLYHVDGTWAGGIGMSENDFDFFVGPNAYYKWHMGTTKLDGTGANERMVLDKVGNLLADGTGYFTALYSSSTVVAPGGLVGNADTATALAANGANCGSGLYPLGVDASGASECATIDTSGLSGSTAPVTSGALDTHENLSGTSAHGADDDNTASAIVTRDASGNFSAGIITATLVGTSSGLDTHAALTNAHSAVAANTADRIVLRDGSGNFSAGTITADVVGSISSLDTHEALTNAHSAVSANTADRIILRDGSGNFSAGVVTASLVGAASDLDSGGESVVSNAEVDDDITLTEITQITNRSHTSLTSIGTTSHADIDTHIAATDAHSAVSANTASRIVLRDGSGNFSAGTITADIVGSIIGADHTDLSNIGTTSHADIDTHIAATDAHSAVSANTASRIVLRDGSGNFSAGIITADLVGSSSGLDTHAALTNAHSAVSANTADRIVLRDGSGNFSAGTVTASLVGAASDLDSGGSSVVEDAEVDDDITLTEITQITNRSHTSITDIGTTSHADIDTHIAATSAHSAVATNTADRIVLRDGSGNFSGGTITASSVLFSGGTTDIATPGSENLVIVPGSGYVGINTTNPTFELEVIGNTKISNLLYTNNLYSLSTDIKINSNAANRQIGFEIGSTEMANIEATTGDFNVLRALEATYGVHAATGVFTGNVGVGGDLDVDGSIGSYGEVYISTTDAAATTIGAVDTFVKSAGTSGLGEARNFTAGGTDNRLTYTGTATKIFDCRAHFTGTSATNSDIIAYRLVKNAAPDTADAQNHTILRKIGTGGDVGSGSVGRLISLATNDYIELWVANTVDDDNVTINAMQMSCMGH